MKVVNTKGLKGKANGDSAGVQNAADTAVLKYLSEQYPADSGKKLEIKHLWESYYRLNFWADTERTKGNGVGKRIVDSRFVKATCDAQGNCQVDERK